VQSHDGQTARIQVSQQIEMVVASDPKVSAGQKCSFIIRPEKIDLHDEMPGENPDLTILPGTIETIVWIGTDTRFTVRLTDSIIVVVRHQNMRLSDPLANLKQGDKVYLSWQKMAARLLAP
jgi:spermidine/putrescine transport system ATP-binding protein